MVYEEAEAWVLAHQTDSNVDAARALAALIDGERMDERSKMRQQAAQACLDSRRGSGYAVAEDNARVDCHDAIMRLPLTYARHAAVSSLKGL